MFEQLAYHRCESRRQSWRQAAPLGGAAPRPRSRRRAETFHRWAMSCRVEASAVNGRSGCRPGDASERSSSLLNGHAQATAALGRPGHRAAARHSRLDVLPRLARPDYGRLLAYRNRKMEQRVSESSRATARIDAAVARLLRHEPPVATSTTVDRCFSKMPASAVSREERESAGPPRGLNPRQ